MSDFKPVNQPITPASADPGEEFPFLHTISVVDRVVSVDKPELVQNNIRTETVTLNLDSEWDGLSCIINIGSGETPTSLIWSGKPVIIPAELMTDIGTLNVSVVGYGDDGAVRAVTKKADAMFVVAASGYVHDDNPVPDPTTILGQLVEAADNANQAADRFNQASEDIGDISDAVTDAKRYAGAAKTSETNAANSATAAQQAVAGLQATVKEQASKINKNTTAISQVSQKADSLERNINSFKTTVSETYTTKTEFNNLQVGGTNIARDTQAFGHNGVSSTEEGYLKGYVNRTNGTYKGLTVRNIISSDGTGAVVCEYLVTNVKHSEYYTLSFWAKGSGKIRTYFYGPSGYIGAKAVSASNGSGGTAFDDGQWNMTLSSSWQRYFVVYRTAASGGTLTDKYMLLRNDNDMASCDVCGVMIERGNKASDWSASPLDVSATYATKTEFKQTTDNLRTELSNYVPLSTYQALEARVQALEAKLANK